MIVDINKLSLGMISRNFSSSSPYRHARKLMCEYFDRPSTPLTKRTGGGLFGMRSLASPAAFLNESRQTLVRCQRTVDLIVNTDPTIDERRRVVKRMDTLSDQICFMVDAAELVRNVHPDLCWVHTADKVYESLGALMNRLNTDSKLHKVLADVLSDRTMKLGEQERKTAELLKFEFEKSGAMMADRESYAALNSRISEYGFLFSRPGQSRQRRYGGNAIRIPYSAMEQVPDIYRRNLSARRASVTHAVILLNQSNAHLFLRYVTDPHVRDQVLEGAENDKKLTLNELLWSRGQLAKQLGHQSFAHYFLQDKMLSSPDAVLRFLEKANEINKPLAAKGSRQSFAGTAIYMPKDMFSFFSVGNVIQGISEIFQTLFGVTLEPKEPSANEVWHQDVRRLDFMHETEGKLGTLYCDLYRRTNATKCEHPAQFTVRCSRRIDDDEVGMFPMEHYEDLKELGVSTRGDRLLQLPVVAISCNFYQPTEHTPKLLSWLELETLFHEFGHALHSMLGQTDFQHVFGTRCKMDFVEVPSILMELFAKHTFVASKFARHHETEMQLPTDRLSTFLANRSRNDSAYNQQQIYFAYLDQALHSDAVYSPDFDDERIVQQVHEKYHVSPYTKSSHLSFSHLFGYGAGYYSYLYSRSIANDIFTNHFLESLNNTNHSKGFDTLRSRGEVFRQEVLAHGGSRDPKTFAWEKLNMNPRNSSAVATLDKD